MFQIPKYLFFGACGAVKNLKKYKKYPKNLPKIDFGKNQVYVFKKNSC